MSLPESRVESLVKLLADDQLQRRLEHLVDGDDEVASARWYSLLEAAEARLKQERPRRCTPSKCFEILHPAMTMFYLYLDDNVK